MAVQQRGPPVRELFVKSGGGMPSFGSFEYEQKESKGNYEIKKKRRAPPPPTGLGGYKPKILSADPDLGNVPINRDGPGKGSQMNGAPGPGRTHTATEAQSENAAPARAMVMGDKDTPMVLHPADDLRDMEVEDHGLRSDVVAVHEGGTETENPLFSMDRQVSVDRQTSVENHMDVVQQNGLGGATENPAFSMEHDGDGKTTDNPLFGMRQHSMEESGTENKEPEGVYIPAPDYDEEEKTIVLTDEPEDDNDPSPQRGRKVYKEYAGEDFSQYLSDDETELGTEHMRRPRRPMHIMDRKSKTEAKRPHYKKRESLPPKNKSEGRRGFSGSASLRDFSYADSKFGTLKGGNDKKRNSLGSLPQTQDDEADLFMSAGSSYEAFLRTKNGETMNDFSSDSGFDTDRGAHPPELPARYRRQGSSKDTLWKKLTWKFKKTMNSFDLDK